MNLTVFILCVGYCLGLLIALVSAGIFSAPLKCILKILFNSLIGAAVLYVFNYFSGPHGFFINLNPITFVFIGILGIPGVLSLIVLCLIL